VVWGSASLLVLGCGDDTGLTPSDESSTGAESTTTAPPITTLGSEDSSTGGGVDSSTGGTTAAAESTTAAAESSSSTGPVELCGNDAVEGDEICDGTDLGGQDCAMQGFDGGELACSTDCSELDTSGCMNFACGNGTMEGREGCDGNDFGGATCQTEGFENGTLGCTLNCALDTDDCGTCGNVIVDGDEACDGILLFGQDCESQGFDSGTLVCNADCLTFDTTGCGLCGNDLVDGEELCDGVQLNGESCTSVGFDSGTLACGTQCGAFDTEGCGTCGNGVIDGDELCDGPALAGESCGTQGFDNGALACAADCYSYVTTGCGTCGNGLVDGSESCDGANLDGETCASLGAISGTLACDASCQFDLMACDVPGLPFGSDSGYNGFSNQGAPLPCDDIVATGTPTGLTDDSNIVVPIGFSFPFYNVDYANVNIMSNGVINFGANTNMTYNNVCLPSAALPSTNNLYVFWDDLNPNVAGASEVYYQTLGAVGDRRFVVQWETAHYGGDGVDLIRVQAMLSEASGQITVCYADTLSLANVGNNGAEATSGIQSSSVEGFDFSCNMPSLVNGLQLLYIPL
jgi:hypothetical protein